MIPIEQRVIAVVNHRPHTAVENQADVGDAFLLKFIGVEIAGMPSVGAPVDGAVNRRVDSRARQKLDTGATDAGRDVSGNTRVIIGRIGICPTVLTGGTTNSDSLSSSVNVAWRRKMPETVSRFNRQRTKFIESACGIERVGQRHRFT